MINQQNVQVKNGSTWNKICPFPVGYVYMSTNSTSPASIYGGSWTSLTGGRYLRAAGTWGNGGSNTISVQQIPSHTHKKSTGTWIPYVGQASGATSGAWQTTITSGSYGILTTGGMTTDIITSVAAGGGQAFYPTYQNVYCWYRTA